MVPSQRTRTRLRLSFHGHAGGWSSEPPSGCSTSDALRLASIVLCLLADWGGLGYRLVHLVSQRPGAKAGCEPFRTGRNRDYCESPRTWATVGNRGTQRKLLGHSGYGTDLWLWELFLCG